MNDMVFVGLGVIVLSAWAALVRVEGNRMLTVVLRLVLPAIFLWLIFGRGGTLLSGIVMFLVFLAAPILVGAYLFAFVRHYTGTKTYIGTLSAASVIAGAAFVLHFRH
jgi:hypothetical protein